MERYLLGIVIPAYNEADTLGELLRSVSGYGRSIVVNDGSTDLTASVALSHNAELVNHKENMGYDAALSSGITKAAELGCAYVITIDADGQHNPSLIEEYIKRFDEGYELVLGVRDKTQRISEKIFSIISMLLWNIKDPLCGMKGYDISFYNKEAGFNSFESIGTEFAVYSVISGKRYAEIPILTRARLDAPRFGRGLRANFKIIRALFTLIIKTIKKGGVRANKQ